MVADVDDTDFHQRLGWWQTNKAGLAEYFKCHHVVLDISNNVILKFAMPVFKGRPAPLIGVEPLIRDNDLCVCGSGKRWRKCCQRLHEVEG